MRPAVPVAMRVVITYYNTRISPGGSDTTTSDPSDRRLCHSTVSVSAAAAFETPTRFGCFPLADAYADQTASATTKLIGPASGRCSTKRHPVFSNHVRTSSTLYTSPPSCTANSPAIIAAPMGSV